MAYIKNNKEMKSIKAWRISTRPKFAGKINKIIINQIDTPLEKCIKEETEKKILPISQMIEEISL